MSVSVFVSVVTARRGRAQKLPYEGKTAQEALTTGCVSRSYSQGAHGNHGNESPSDLHEFIPCLRFTQYTAKSTPTA
jgi:hypothetical protein